MDSTESHKATYLMGGGGHFVISSDAGQSFILLEYLNFNTDLGQDVHYKARGCLSLVQMNSLVQTFTVLAALNLLV